ncbi:MAG: hypothetical protein BWY82_01158 [Verrucomicrobia bacterium ADurb.Bin474]|nr:MAG: hypothetical protein BWY82_01158 [Verrucomicrobia bacterium ADurb.Bin474]
MFSRRDPKTRRMRYIETCWQRLKAEAIVVGVDHPASFASDVKSSSLNNVCLLGPHGKKREQGCSRYYGSMPRAQSKGCRFEEEEILAQRPGDPDEEKWNQPLMKMMKTDDGLPGRASHPCLSVWIPPSLLELWRTRSGCVLFSSSFVVFEHFVVHPLQPLWRGRRPKPIRRGSWQAHSTRLLIKTIQRSL